MIDWLRAAAYSELGERRTALKYAAWAALPEMFRTADNNITKTGLVQRIQRQGFAALLCRSALGSAGLGFENTTMAEGMLREGRNNPAALDFRPQMVTMSLAVQRALLNQRLGNVQQANAALADLKRWEDNRWMAPDSFGIPGLSMASNIKPWKGRAQLLSIGPLFAQGNYEEVAAIYEQLALKVASMRRTETLKKSMGWNILSGEFIESMMSRSDARLFTLAVEDVSNALLYSQSLSRLGKYDQARACSIRCSRCPKSARWATSIGWRCTSVL